MSGRIDLETSLLEIGPKPPGTGIGAVWRLTGICTDEAIVSAIELSLKMQALNCADVLPESKQWYLM